jgi:hypothetical protein
MVLTALYFGKKTKLINKKIDTVLNVGVEKPEIITVPVTVSDTPIAVHDLPGDSTVESDDVADRVNKKKEILTSTTVEKKVTPAVQKRQRSVDPVNTEISRPSENTELVSEDVIMDELSSAVRRSDNRNAEKLFVKFQINDAEYYLVYAEFQIGQGNFALAQQNAIKAMQTQSKRLNPDQVRTKSFYLKAKALSGVFNERPDLVKGQAAMEAWYDVKFQYRSETDTPEFGEADREIRRISAEIQK